MTQQLSKDEYIAWLSEQHWQTIKDEAESVEFDKPDDLKWAEVIDEIGELKYSETEEIEEIIESTSEPVVEEEKEEVAESPVKNNFEFVKENKVLVCRHCGYQIRTDIDNKTLICPIEYPECPRS